MSAGGSFASLTFDSQDSYENWPNSVYTYEIDFLLEYRIFKFLLLSKLGLCFISLLIPETVFFHIFRGKLTILLRIS